MEVIGGDLSSEEEEVEILVWSGGRYRQSGCRGVDETTPEEEQVEKEEAVEERKSSKASDDIEETVEARKPSKASDDIGEAAKVKSNSYKPGGTEYVPVNRSAEVEMTRATLPITPSYQRSRTSWRQSTTTRSP